MRCCHSAETAERLLSRIMDPKTTLRGRQKRNEGTEAEVSRRDLRGEHEGHGGSCHVPHDCSAVETTWKDGAQAWQGQPTTAAVVLVPFLGAKVGHFVEEG